MARKRMIDPNYWSDDKIIELNHRQRLLYIALWNFADDSGILKFSPRSIKAKVFPADNIDIDTIKHDLYQFIEYSLIKVSKCKNLIQITNWSSYQKINRPTPSNYEFEPIDADSLTIFIEEIHGVLTEQSLNNHGTLTDDSLPIEVNRIEVNRIEKNRTEHQNPKNDFEGVCFDFESFWKTYPRKQSKQVAKDRINKLSLKTKKLIVEVLPAHIKYWKDAGTEPEHIPLLSTWINQKRWEDDLDSITSKQTTSTSYKYDSTGKIIGWCSKCKVSSFYQPFNIDKTDSTCCLSKLLFKKPEAPLKKETTSKVGTPTKDVVSDEEMVIIKPKPSKYKMKHQDNMDNGAVMISELIGDYKQKKSNEG